MILLIDIGNSYLKTALFDPSQPIRAQNWQSQRFPLHTRAIEGLDQSWQTWLSPQMKEVSAIFFANVAEQCYEKAVVQLAENRGKPLHKINTETAAFGVTNGYREPLQLGVDRWLTLVAARQISQESLLIIDIGTAITLDLINQDGKHLGGWIAPGYQLMSQAIFDYAARIKPHQQRTVPNPLENQFDDHAHIKFGDNTHVCLHHGCIAALVGFIDHGLVQARELLNNSLLQENKNKSVQSPTLMLLGGGIRHLPESILTQAIVNQNLIFEGMAYYAKLNTDTLSPTKIEK